MSCFTATPVVIQVVIGQFSLPIMINDHNDSKNNIYGNTFLRTESDVNDLGKSSAHNMF